MIKMGYQRVLEKIDDIEQNFSNAVTMGSRSGIGKIIFKYFHSLSKICGNSSVSSRMAETVTQSTMSQLKITR